MTGSSQAMITLAIATIKIVNTTRARKLNSSIHRRIRAPFFGRIPPRHRMNAKLAPSFQTLTILGRDRSPSAIGGIKQEINQKGR